MQDGRQSSWGWCWRSAWLLAALHCAGVASAQQPAPAAPAAAPSEDEARALAKQRFEQGVADYDAGRYEQALANFQEAYRLRPHPLVNVNIANCYDKLGKPLQAMFHFERFVEAQVGTPEQRTEVVNALERLRGQVGQLLLRITPDGAMVTIDQGEQRRAPILEGIKFEAGTHTLVVRLEGYKTLQRSVTVRGGTTLELNLALERETDAQQVLSVTPATTPEPAQAGAPVAAAVAPPPREADLFSGTDTAGGAVPTSVWIAGGVTGALAVTALVTGVMALSADADFEARREQLALASSPNARVAIYAAASDSADDAQALALTTDILLVATALGAAVTTYLALSTPLTPELGKNGGGVRLRGAF